MTKPEASKSPRLSILSIFLALGGMFSEKKESMFIPDPNYVTDDEFVEFSGNFVLKHLRRNEKENLLNDAEKLEEFIYKIVEVIPGWFYVGRKRKPSLEEAKNSVKAITTEVLRLKKQPILLKE